MSNIELEDVLTHFADVLTDTARILKMTRDVSSFRFYSEPDILVPKQIKTKEDLVKFLQIEFTQLMRELDNL